MHPEVVETTLALMHNPPGNPSSLYNDATQTVGREPRKSLISGGEHETKPRAGTENVAGSVGPGRAAELVGLEMDQRRHYLDHLKDVFELQERANKLAAVIRQAAG